MKRDTYSAISCVTVHEHYGERGAQNRKEHT
jgi:hypothetical protein